MISIQLGLGLIVVHWLMVAWEYSKGNNFRVRVYSSFIKGPYSHKVSYHKTWEQASKRASGWSGKTLVSIERKSFIKGEWA